MPSRVCRNVCCYQIVSWNKNDQCYCWSSWKESVSFQDTHPNWGTVAQGRLMVRSHPTAGFMSKYPWVRYWTPTAPDAVASVWVLFTHKDTGKPDGIWSSLCHYRGVRMSEFKLPVKCLERSWSPDHQVEPVCCWACWPQHWSRKVQGWWGGLLLCIMQDVGIEESEETFSLQHLVSQAKWKNNWLDLSKSDVTKSPMQ